MAREYSSSTTKSIALAQLAAEIGSAVGSSVSEDDTYTSGVAKVIWSDTVNTATLDSAIAAHTALSTEHDVHIEPIGNVTLTAHQPSGITSISAYSGDGSTDKTSLTLLADDAARLVSQTGQVQLSGALGVSICDDGTGDLGFFGAASDAQQTITGVPTGGTPTNDELADSLSSLIAALAAYGLIIDGGV